jgi:hypothetical protein
MPLAQHRSRVPAGGTFYARNPTSKHRSAVHTTALTVDHMNFLRTVNAATTCARRGAAINSFALLFNHMTSGWTLNARPTCRDSKAAVVTVAHVFISYGHERISHREIGWGKYGSTATARLTCRLSPLLSILGGAPQSSQAESDFQRAMEESQRPCISAIAEAVQRAIAFSCFPGLSF